MNKSNNPLKVALHGMDALTSKTMVMYLQGQCKGVAIVVSDSEADIDIFDADVVGAERLMQEHHAQRPHRPVIALSLCKGSLEYVLYVKKPLKTDVMLVALVKASSLCMKVPENLAEKTQENVTVMIQKESTFVCPKCQSTNLTGNKKGFGLGKAIFGGVLVGGIGLLGGFIGSQKVRVTCMECGHSWVAGKK